MRKLFSTKKRIAASVLAVAIIAATGGIAAAYFTSTGTGTGSGAVGTATNNIHVIGTETTPLFPGGATGSVTFTAWNTAVNPEHLSTIHLTTITPDGSHPTCATVLGTDFSMGDVSVGADGTLAGGGSTPGTSITETGTLTMLDSGVSQNACEGATLTLAFTTS